MDAEICVDRVLAVETMLNELFRNVFENDSARRYLKFDSISQSSTDQGYPLWYIWFAGKPGAYGIMVEPEPSLFTRLSIRYFPQVEDPLFSYLSGHEQQVRTGAAFDSTGTPSFEGRRSIPEHFFLCGYLDIILRGSGSDVDIRCTAPDRWREYRNGVQTPGGNDRVPRGSLQPDEVDRNFPGWEVSLFLFEKLISGFCLLLTRVPGYVCHAVQTSCSDGINGNLIHVSEKDPEACTNILGVSFCDCSGEDSVAGGLMQFLGKAYQQGHYQVNFWEHPQGIPDSLKNFEWWTVNDMHFHCSPNYLCSCYHNH